MPENKKTSEISNVIEKTNEEELNKKKEALKRRIISLTANKYFIGLLGIIALATAIRLYYFFITKNQAHWWDTLAYGSLAKDMVFGLWSNNPFILQENIIRPPLLPLLWSWLLRFNISETGALFLLEVIPSILSVLLIYLIAKELYDEKIALISGFIASVVWINLFYTTRIMTDIPGLFFALLSIYFFVKTYEKIEFKFFALSIFALSLAVLTRYSYFLIGLVYLVFLAVIHRHKILMKKSFWLGGIVGAILLIIFVAINLSHYGSLLPASSVYSSGTAASSKFAFYILGFIPYILKSLFTILFVIGAIIALWEFALGFDMLSKVKNLRSHLFSLLLIIITLFYFIFILKAAEDRYLIVLFPVLFTFSAITLLFIYNFAKKYSKIGAIFIILAVLIIGAYSQITFGNSLIQSKKQTYAQMKDAFLWIKSNTPSDAVIVGDGIDPYAIYYAERKVIAINSSELNKIKMQADYVVIHAFEHQTQEALNYVANKTGTDFIPVQAFYFDAARKQAAVVVYKVNK